MFNMNPAAKEFVPAHILKKRQEDAERLGELTERLDKVDIKSDNKVEGIENGQTPTSNSSNNKDKSSSSENSKVVQENSSHITQSSDGNDVKPQPSNNNSNNSNKDFTSSSSSSSTTNNLQQQNNGQYTNKNINNNHESGYPEGSQDLIDEEDDRFLLNAGENLCEFNGEQFIIPGDDDEYEPAMREIYDFGNEEDNEDEDVRNAFEEFLGNLPGQ